MGTYLHMKYKLQNEDAKARAARPERHRRTTRTLYLYKAEDTPRFKVSLSFSLKFFSY